MPVVDPAFIEFLFDRAAGHDAAVPEQRDGHRQPTQAVYHVDRTLNIATRRLAADSRSLHGMLAELDTVVVPAETVADHTAWRSLRDINSRAEFDRLT
jgi:molybdopterin-guanine dinucleotide biosynthesis protein A